MYMAFEGYIASQNHQLQLRGVHYSAIGILSMDAWCTECVHHRKQRQWRCLCGLFVHPLLPILMQFSTSNNNSVVVLDNASIHHIDAAVNAICGVGALVIFLPPSKPYRVCFW